MFVQRRNPLDGPRESEMNGRASRIVRPVTCSLVAGCVAILMLACASSGPVPEKNTLLAECDPGDGFDGALCAQIRVFEDRERAAGRTIDLRVVVYPAFDNDPRPDPVFVLAGGPGQGAAQASPAVVSVLREVREERDIVFVDQRGTGESNGLDCEFDTDDLNLLFDEDLGIENLKRCLAGYAADVRHYTTPVAMDDLDEVRDKLGYPNINIWGGSYGTRAALVYLRRHGDRVRSVVLDGAVPLGMKIPLSFPEDMQRALDLMLDACEREDTCHVRFPELRSQLDAVLDRLKQRPARVTMDHPTTGEVVSFSLPRVTVLETLGAALYTPRTASMLPILIEQAYRGDFAGLVALGFASEPRDEGRISPGMFFSVVCAEDLPWFDKEELRSRAFGSFMGESTAERWARVCDFWPRGSVSEDYHEPVRSDVPALVLSGAFDPVTPPRWGDKLAEGLTSMRHVVVPGAAHGTTAEGCVPKLVAEFIQTGSADDLDYQCVDGRERPPFFVTPSGPSMEAGN